MTDEIVAHRGEAIGRWVELSCCGKVVSRVVPKPVCVHPDHRVGRLYRDRSGGHMHSEVKQILIALADTCVGLYRGLTLEQS